MAQHVGIEKTSSVPIRPGCVQVFRAEFVLLLQYFRQLNNLLTMRNISDCSTSAGGIGLVRRCVLPRKKRWLVIDNF